LSKIRAYGSTFLIFSDYMKMPIRLSSVMEIPSIWIFTHDSIGVGEDGPTHQPIEQLITLRAVPGLMTLRPADGAAHELEPQPFGRGRPGIIRHWPAPQVGQARRPVPPGRSSEGVRRRGPEPPDRGTSGRDMASGALAVGSSIGWAAGGARMGIAPAVNQRVLRSGPERSKRRAKHGSRDNKY